MSSGTCASYKPIILTGDRPTGPLHLGHYVGSLQSRVVLQHSHEQYIMIADLQALTDHYDNSEKVHNAVMQVALDYLSVGIDPAYTTIFIQSQIPQIAELTILFLNLVTINRLKRNPTVKAEIQQKGFGELVTAGFLMYPVSQAADIAILKAEVVPVGADQLPMIEQTNELIRAFNLIYRTDILVEAKPLLSSISRLPGVDGKMKMSKSLGNALYLSDSADVVAKKVRSMYTDPHHLRVEDPGSIDGNTVFTYLDLFDPHKEEVASLKAHYTRGGLGDMALKKRLIERLEELLAPIRERRREYEADLGAVRKMICDGSLKVRNKAEETMSQVRKAVGLVYDRDIF